jgi:hypothetical protein
MIMLGRSDIICSDAPNAFRYRRVSRVLLRCLGSNFSIRNGANFKKRQASLNQPSDPQHANGQDTYLQAMIQGFQINTQTNDNGSPSIVSQSTGPAPYIAPSPDAADGHRYTIMLFEQPQGWTLPASLQQAVSQRKDFDIRKFMAATGFTVPVYGNWMIISPQGKPLTVSTASTLTTLPNGGPTITLPVTTTVPVSGAVAPSTGSPTGGHSVIPGVSTFYTTGFIGFTLLTSKVTTKYTVTAQLPKGSFTLIPAAATLTVTRAFSGVSHVSLSTYVTAATETLTESAVIDGQATTWTTTMVNVGYTTSAESVNAAPTPAPQFGLGGVAAAVAGLLGVALGAI